MCVRRPTLKRECSQHGAHTFEHFILREEGVSSSCSLPRLCLWAREPGPQGWEETCGAVARAAVGVTSATGCNRMELGLASPTWDSYTWQGGWGLPATPRGAGLDHPKSSDRRKWGLGGKGQAHHRPAWCSWGCPASRGCAASARSPLEFRSGPLRASPGL